MLGVEPPEPDADVAKNSLVSHRAVDSPILVSVTEARRHFGGIGTTAFYAAVKRHGIRLVKLGGRSLVPMAEVERIVAELISIKLPAETIQKAKVLASQSVAARRARRGSKAP